jgi:alkylated DNA repair protein alkB family protein 8
MSEAMVEAAVEAKEVLCITKTPMMHPIVDGLLYWPRFISPDGERILTESMSRDTNWVGVTDSAKSRRVIHYGYKYDYTRAMDPIKCDPIPAGLAIITAMCHIAPADASATHLVDTAFDQLIINEYQPGQGIAAHIDHPQQFGDTVFCVTLGAGTMINFTHPDGRVVQQYVAPGSAYAMQRDARHTWKHGIDAKKSDMVDGVKVPRGVRYSLTFRTIRK